MANINTYAKLIKPKQFRPNEEVRIRMEYSQNLTCCSATLKIDGYSITVNSTEEAKKEDFGNSIGIELNNLSTGPYSIYGLIINGFIKNFRYGIKNNIPVACFPTAVTFNCQIDRCVTAIDFGESGIMGSQVFGEIQSGMFFTEETKYKYPLFIGNVNKVYFDCYVWDLNLVNSKNIYTNTVVLNLTRNSSPIFGEMFKTFLPYVRGSANSIYNEYKHTM